jgi:hypothetical protein
MSKVLSLIRPYHFIYCAVCEHASEKLAEAEKLLWGVDYKNAEIEVTCFKSPGGNDRMLINYETQVEGKGTSRGTGVESVVSCPVLRGERGRW